MKAGRSKRDVQKKAASKVKPSKPVKSKTMGKKGEAKSSLKKKGKDGDDFEEFEIEEEAGEMDFPIEERFEDDYDGFEEEDDF